MKSVIVVALLVLLVVILVYVINRLHKSWLRREKELELVMNFSNALFAAGIREGLTWGQVNYAHECLEAAQRNLNELSVLFGRHGKSPRNEKFLQDLRMQLQAKRTKLESLYAE